MGPQLGQIGHGMFTRPLQCDDGRDVHLVDVYEEGSKVSLAVKAWTVERFGCNTAQVFNELRARMSPLSNSQYVVLPLHVSSSREGGMTMVYPYAGVNLDTVCAALRSANLKTQLVTQLAQVATSVLLTLQKLQAQKPQAWVHRDVKLDNLLLGEDGLVRLADFGSLGDVGDNSTAHDPTFFPPDWAALLPDGRHVFEDAASLAAANIHVLDLRGLGMALIQGYAGRLPADVSLDGAGQLNAGSSSSSMVSSVGTPCGSRSSSSSSSSHFDAQEKARLLRIAQHDWQHSIDQLIPDAPALNQLVKLLMGPRDAVPSLSKLLQQPLIKAVHRQVLDTARRARKPWLAHVAACRAAAWRVLAPLMQLEQQLLQVCSDGTLSTMPCLSEQLELLAQQYAQQQGELQELQAAAAETPTCGDLSGSDTVAVHAAHPSSSASAGATAVPAPPCNELQTAVTAAMLQLAAARPDAAARIAELQQELLQLAAGTPLLEAGVCAPLRPCTPGLALPEHAGVKMPVRQEAGDSPAQPPGVAQWHGGAVSTPGQELLQVSTPTAGHPAGAMLADSPLGLGTPRLGEAAVPSYARMVGHQHSQEPPSRAVWDLSAEDVMQYGNAPGQQQSSLFAAAPGLGVGWGNHLCRPVLAASPRGAGMEGCEWAGMGVAVPIECGNHARRC